MLIQPRICARLTNGNIRIEYHGCCCGYSASHAFVAGAGCCEIRVASSVCVVNHGRICIQVMNCYWSGTVAEIGRNVNGGLC